MDSVSKMLAMWDAGESIWTIELGGFGPGYEQALQVAAIEMARDNCTAPLPEDSDARNSEWDRLCTETLRKHDQALGGLSGAQFGAARWLAYQWCHGAGGPEGLIERAKAADRDRILVSKAWPRAAELAKEQP